MSIYTPKIITKVYHKVFSSNFTRFVAIGGIGFVVNYAVLLVLFDILGVPIIISQIIGAEVALLSTFVGNNFWAFREHHHIPVKKKLLKYHLTSGAGICITSTCVIVLVKYSHFYYGLALVIAAGIGMVWNYTFNSKIIFKRLHIPTE